MKPSIRRLENLNLVAPLGLRFHDTASGEFVRDGLNVTVHPVDRPSARAQAIANRIGIYVLHHAPGLRAVESGSGDEMFWSPPPAGKDFVIEVEDWQRRYQPFHFTEQLPVKGIYQWANPLPTSPPSSLNTIPLYSAPTRSAPGGMAVIRAELWDRARDVPAAWAVLEGYLDNELIVRGIADLEGRVALIFPYPAPSTFVINSPPSSPVSSPPIASGPPIMGQEWLIQLRALYSANDQALSPPDSFAAKPSSPDLRFTLLQPEATIWADAAGTQPLTEMSLRYGREAILKSTSTTSPPSARSSVLFISPAESPP